MENKQEKVVNAPTTIKERADKMLNRTLYIKDQAFDPKDIIRFALNQSGIKADQMTNTEVLYVLNTCKQKGLNPMNGEISFFKARSGKIQAIPKYTTQGQLLGQEFKKDPNFITFNVFIKRETDTQEGVATAKADYVDAQKGRYSRELSLYSGDGKCSNGMVRFMLMKQAELQFIRVYYPHIDLGYDMDELQTFNSGIKENPPKDSRIVDIEVAPQKIKELK